MKTLKVKSILFSLMAIMAVTIFLTSCEQQYVEQAVEDSNHTTVEELITTQGFSTEKMDMLYGHLASQPNLSQLDMSDRFQVLKEFCESENIEFHLEPAIESYESAANVNQSHLSNGEIFVQDQFNIILGQMTQLHLTPELKVAMEAYRADLIADISDSEIDVTYYNTALELSWMVEYMATSKVFHRYAGITQSNQLNYDEDTESTIDLRGGWDCFLATIGLAGAITTCATTLNPWSCLSILGATTAVVNNCNNDTTAEGPCENSPNPCCGVSCIQGYGCNTSNGNCEEIPGYNCPGGCPDGEQCLDGICVPW